MRALACSRWSASWTASGAMGSSPWMLRPGLGCVRRSPPPRPGVPRRVVRGGPGRRLPAHSVAGAPAHGSRSAAAVHPLRDVVAIEPAILHRVRGRHGATVRPNDWAPQQCRSMLPVLHYPGAGADLPDGVGPVPRVARHDPPVLTGIDLSLVRGLACKGSVVQQLADIALVQRAARLAGGALRPEASHPLDA